MAAYPALMAFKKRVDPRRYNGATLVGLKGVVVKSHGGADVLGFGHALYKAHAEVVGGVLDKIAREVAATEATMATPPPAAPAAVESNAG
jgi:glycerol-3-phosphate acyltransferase PlsX